MSADDLHGQYMSLPTCICQWHLLLIEAVTARNFRPCTGPCCMLGLMLCRRVPLTFPVSTPTQHLNSQAGRCNLLSCQP